jgi:hypothetical protein
MASVRRFPERRLRLRVNQQKSAVAAVGERKFLGYRLDADGTLGIAPKSLARAKSLPQRRPQCQTLAAHRAKYAANNAVEPAAKAVT